MRFFEHSVRRSSRPIHASLAPLVTAMAAVGALAGACAAPPGAPPAPAATPRSEPVASASASEAPVAIDTTPPPVASSAPPAPPQVPTVDLGTFAHELDEPVVSLGIGDPKVAVLGVEPWLYTVGKWKKIAFPEKFKPAGGQPYNGRIFFGRDDRVRIMGTREKDGHAAQLYLRHRNDIWIEEKKEVAKLLDPPAQPLWGILGNADPEVACKLDDICIVKRRSGWKTMPAGPGTPRVDLFDGVAWAMHPDSVAKLEKDKRWITIGSPAPFKNATGFAASGDEVWVGEETNDKLHHFRNGVWTTEPSPVSGPRGMWATTREDVWLAGVGGLAHYDGKTWSRVNGPLGPLVEVQGRDADVWAVGKTGVWARHGKHANKSK